MSIVFFSFPAAIVQGAVSSSTARQTESKTASATAAKPAKKAAAATGTASKSQPQPTAKKATAHNTAATPVKTKTPQTAGTSSPAPNNAGADAKHTESKPAAAVAAKSVQAGSAPKKVATRRSKSMKPAAVPATASVAAGVLQEFDKQISSRSAIVMDADTGEELFAKYPDNPRQPASTIKIVTAMIALKSLKNDDIIDVSDHAAGMPSSKIFLDTSKHYQANDLINAVLLASANDASVALAEKIAGSEDNFANLMTLSAKMWGARNTVCRTASGLTALGQQSTARDLANLFRYAMQHDEFANRMHEKFISTSYGKVLRNHNKALWKLDGAMGGKTGYTVAARQTYVGQFSRDNQTIVVAIMGSESMWADLEKLVDYGFRKKKEEQLARLGSDSAGSKATRVN